MNNTNEPNSTEKAATCKYAQPDQVTAVSFSVSYGVVLVLAVVGNSLVINYARKTRRIRKSNVFNLFLICMATADILAVLTVALLHWIFVFFGLKWIGGIFGLISCKLIYFLVDVSIFASVLTLVAITVDRYLTICYINYTPLSRAKARFIIAGIWVSSGLLSSVQLYKSKIIEHQKQAYCAPFWDRDDPEKQNLGVKYEMTLKFAVSYGIPLLLMIVLYGLIIRQLRKRLRSLVVENNAELQQQIAQQNRPLVEMFITLVTMFAICWFPVHVNHMLIAFDYETYLCLPTAVPLLFYLLAHANAAINPLLYFIFIGGFRKELQGKARGLWKWATKNDEPSNSGRIIFFRSRNPSLRKRQNTNKDNNANHKDNNAPADPNPEPAPSTPEPSPKPTNEITSVSTNSVLSTQADMSHIGVSVKIQDRPDSFPPLQVERSLEREGMDWRINRRHSNGSIRSSRSLTVDCYVNKAYETDNTRYSKSVSLPWKLSTFV